VLIQAAINGGRSSADHAAVPTTAQAFAREAKLAADAGARAFHVHCRDDTGRQSCSAEDVARALDAIRTACPGIPVGVSTGAWMVPNPEARLAMIRDWKLLPDYASVNVNEAGARELIELLLERGVGVEAGVWNDSDTDWLVASGLGPRCLRALIEPMEKDTSSALTNLARIEAILDAAALRIPRMVHGVDATAWPVLRTALERGYDTRIGFEDTLTLPDGSPAPSNGALVAAAVRIADEMRGAPHGV
jgi:uncharacterized protein (DUF849 family)